MGSKGDFHTHSTASDGRLTPTQLVDLVASQGVQYHALTDHDSTEGVSEARVAAGKHPNYHLIPGVEFGTDIEGAEIHMLGLFLSPDDAELQSILKELRDGRLDRGEGIVNKLREQGKMIEWSRVQEIAGDAAVGRPHIAQALVEAGYVKKVADAFDTLIGRNGTAYVERRKMTPADAVQFIIGRGGLACWAHPADMGITNEQVEPILKGLKEAGMQAMEVFYKDYSPARRSTTCFRSGAVTTTGSSETRSACRVTSHSRTRRLSACWSWVRSSRTAHWCPDDHGRPSGRPLSTAAPPGYSVASCRDLLRMFMTLPPFLAVANDI
jgi:predicted metal-dependent phosphoesterase TrpH